MLVVEEQKEAKQIVLVVQGAEVLQLLLALQTVAVAGVTKQVAVQVT